jgi:transcriptional regulator with XRE-family HTH domain
MGKAGQALRQVLEKYGISQYKLASTLGIERNNVSRWVREERDPTAERVVDIVRALAEIDIDAAREFVQVYIVDEVP